MSKTMFKLNYNCLGGGINSRTGNCLVETQNSLDMLPSRLVKIVNTNGIKTKSPNVKAD